jgi:predicted MFS family arabinose efflux permease
MTPLGGPRSASGSAAGIAAADGTPISRRYAWYALILLAAINVLNYLDRNVIFALFDPIKRDLALTDAQLGWLGSAYILVYSVCALPFGVLSDLRSRRSVIASGVAIWSAATLLSGLARGFGSLFLARSAVGVGEAAYGPASGSMVARYFPGKGRALALGILSSGIALGGVLGILLGGKLETLYGWRVAFMAVALPGFLFAFLAYRLKEPGQPPPVETAGEMMADLRASLRPILRYGWPLLLSMVLGLTAGWFIDRFYSATTALDAAVFAVVLMQGVAVTFVRWARQARGVDPDADQFADQVHVALRDLVRAGALVLKTPTLKYVFPAGALISFGMNGLTGWAPTYITRTLGLSAGDAAVLLGKWGLIFGTLGTLAGGFLADALLRRTPSGRVLTCAIGMLAGGPLAIWLLTLRDPAMFVPVFCAAFFFLTWYNGPINAVIFDVVPSRIGATVAGAYLLFIHLVGDAVAFPLVGMLSDRYGLGSAILVLPAVSLLGGLVVLGAAPSVRRDSARARRMEAKHPDAVDDPAGSDGAWVH